MILTDAWKIARFIVHEIKCALADSGGSGSEEQIEILEDINESIETGNASLTDISTGITDLYNTAREYRTVEQFRVTGTTPPPAPYAGDTTAGVTKSFLSNTIYSISVSVEAGSAKITIGGSVQTHTTGYSMSLEGKNGVLANDIVIESVDSTSVISILTIKQ